MEYTENKDKNYSILDEYSTVKYINIENFIKTKDEIYLNRGLSDINEYCAMRLHAQITMPRYKNVGKEAFTKFFEDETIKLITYGYSSDSMRSHNIYRSENNEIYVVHNFMGKISDAFYLTTDEVSEYFFNEKSNKFEFPSNDFLQKISKLK